MQTIFHYLVNLVNDKDNMPKCGVIPVFSDLEVIVLCLNEKTMDSEKSG